MAKVTNLTHARLIEMLDYDSASGVLVWKVAASNRNKVGDDAGSFHGQTGARYVTIDGERFLAHRLVWFYHHGEWPKDDIRALDGDFDNLKIENLRDIPRINIAHTRGAPKTNSSGFLGVSPSSKRGKWQSSVTWSYKQVSLGSNFKTPEEASEIYQEAVARLKAAETKADVQAIIADLRVLRRKRATWAYLQRTNPDHAWGSFEEFSKDVSEIPLRRYAMVPVDVALPIGPANFRWALPIDEEHNSAQDRNAYVRSHKKHNRDLHRAKHLKKEYGADIAYERQKLVEQNGCCAICGNPEELSRGNESRALSLDHDHKTNALRGLLCGNCNLSVGYLMDDPEIMRKAIAYLAKYANPSTNVVQMGDFYWLSFGKYDKSGAA